LVAASDKSVRESFEPPGVRDIDQHVAAVANLVDNWSINAALDVAWDTTVALWDVRDHEKVVKLLTDALARRVAMVSRLLLVAV
jgi:hypothetical protein